MLLLSEPGRSEMHARLSRWAGLPPERLSQTVREFEQQSLPVLEQQSGFGGVVVMVAQSAGKAAAVTFWDSVDDMKATDKLAEEMRERAERTAQAEREPVVDHYEVVLRK
jgi:heme-degrading monooxygenase HmoA